MKLKGNGSLSSVAALVLLLFLAVMNAAWLIKSRHRGALIACIAYSLVLILCLQNQDYRAGEIVGVLGFGIHVYELLTQRTNTLMGIDTLFFYVNLTFPIPLIITSYFAFHTLKVK
jgi:hypothetical protein